jgi:hypothetical protein
MQNRKQWVKVFIWIVVLMMVLSFVVAIIPAIG